MTTSIGYQKFTGYKSGEGLNRYGVALDNPDLMIKTMSEDDLAEMYLYTQHQIDLVDDELQQTRSSPNWDGQMVTFATCKHNMRTYSRDTWVGTWIGGLCPKSCSNNCLLFAGKIEREFESNYDYSNWLRQNRNQVWLAKRASNNPRGDCYTPRRELDGKERFDHRNFIAPEGHTRSVEFYDKSAGSVSDREDGKIPKWWRDIEYQQHKRHPPVFVMNPCFIFSKPMFWTKLNPGRATLRLAVNSFVEQARWD